MFNKNSFTDDLYTSRGFDLVGGQIRSSRNQYDHSEKLDDEAKTATEYLPQTYYNLNSTNDFKIGNHIQELSEKFQELETKMFEVEKCFKEGNKLENDEGKLIRNTDIKSPSDNVQNMQRSRLYEISGSRKDTRNTSLYPAAGIKDWFGDHDSTATERKKLPNRVNMDGSGDTPQIQNGGWSDDSCKTLTKSVDKPSEHLPIRHGAKGIFTLNHFDEVLQRQSSNSYMFGVNQHQSTDIDFLEKSKKLILTLIDNELKKIETKSSDSFPTNQTAAKADNPTDGKRNMKIECINNIERELKTLKKLESLEQ